MTLKQLFCRHQYSVLHYTYYNTEGEVRLGSEDVYYCRKCGKIKKEPKTSSK